MSHHRKDKVLIIGSGLAGLTCAIELAERGYKVLVVTKTAELGDCNTAWAQGGIVQVDDQDSQTDDSYELLARDIIKSGDELCNLEAVEQLTTLGNRLVKQHMIEKVGVAFDRDKAGHLAKSREGAHARSRVIHIGDASGRAIHRGYLDFARQHQNIEFLTNYTAVDLLTKHHHCRDARFKYSLDNLCCGAYLINNETDVVETAVADYTVLATGGAGQLFLHTTNNKNAIGDGLVMAHRAGADLLFPHYIQFHPTTLFKGKQSFLISEVVRGSGAQLLNAKGERFMQRYHPEQKELAPRDELTRAIIQEMLKNDDDCVYLDLSTHRKEEGQIEARFPTIFERCMQAGIDIRKEPIPVVPAAHYLCGGIKVNLSGQTSLPHLYAVGEVSCTGVHGANRLASTSLLECLTWGHTAAHSIADALDAGGVIQDSVFETLRDWQSVGNGNIGVDKQRIAGDWRRLRTVMWNYVGIIRNKKLLDIAAKDFQLLGEMLTDLYFNASMSAELVDLFHGIRACQIIAEAARKDNKSAGCHYLTD